MGAYLAILAGAPAQSILLEEAPAAVLAGRAPDCGLVLQNPEVSRYHCRFVWDGSSCSLEDLGSRQGTAVNGQSLSAKVTLRPGDKIDAGPVQIAYRVGGPPPRRQEPLTPAEIPLLVHGEPVLRLAPPPTGEWIIGRDPQCDAVLNHPGVSRRHASLRRVAGGGCSMTDLHSSGGTFLNGRRFDSVTLTVGDCVQIGPFDFEYDGGALARVTAARGASLRLSEITQEVGGRHILEGVSFRISASEFVGILGPSGAGKSTLLHTMAGLLPPSRGHVFVETVDVYAGHAAHAFGLVPQEDIVHGDLTVSEALRFSARLRLSASTPPHEIQKLILQTMDHLGLRPNADQRIGDLSGGQRKRVSVAVELLARPAILFLDEPSSGLDPAAEFHLMELLRELTNTGCTVVCTTHVLENAYLMDQLIIITGGCLAFAGAPQEARDYFSVSRLHALYERLLDRPAVEWKHAFTPPSQSEVPLPSERPGAISGNRPQPAWAPPILIARQWSILRSDWRNFLILASQPLVIAALVAWATADQSLALFFGYVATLWFGCSNGAQEIGKELPIFARERLVGVGAQVYLVSKFAFLFAVTAAQAFLLYFVLVVAFHGLDGAAVIQVAALLGTALAAVGIGLAISALAKTVMQAVLVVPLVLIPQILLSGQPIAANEMRPPVHFVASAMPAFAAQTLIDASFLWGKPIDHATLGDHWTSFRNLDRDGSLRTGEVYRQKGPIFAALECLFVWVIAVYLLAWGRLRKISHR